MPWVEGHHQGLGYLAVSRLDLRELLLYWCLHGSRASTLCVKCKKFTVMYLSYTMVSIVGFMYLSYTMLICWPSVCVSVFST